jgi:hypothetical protein
LVQAPYLQTRLLLRSQAHLNHRRARHQSRLMCRKQLSSGSKIHRRIVRQTHWMSHKKKVKWNRLIH